MGELQLGRTRHAVRRRIDIDDRGGDHPVDDLQHSAGNAATRELLTGAAPDRSDLGHASSQPMRSALARRALAVQRQPDAPPKADPADTAGRPTQSELETIAQGYIGAWVTAAGQGLNTFEKIMADDVDWGPFWLQVAGNLIWATACFATGPVGIAGIALSASVQQFAISTAGIAVAAAGAAAGVSSSSDFHVKALADHIHPVEQQLNDKVKSVAAAVYSTANQQNWTDNQTRTVLISRLLAPEYWSTFSGGIPNVHQAKIETMMTEKLIFEGNTLGQQKNPQFGIFNTGEFLYRLDVSNVIDSDVAWYEFKSVKHVYDWQFHPRSVSVSMPAGGKRAIQALKRAAAIKPIEPANLKMGKRVILQSVDSGGSWVQDDTFEFMLDENNNVHLTRPDGAFLHGMRGPSDWARSAMNKMWASTGGKPPPVSSFEAE